MAQATAPARTVSLSGTHWVGQFYVYCPVVDTESEYPLLRDAETGGRAAPTCAGCGVIVTEELMDKENALPAAVRLATLGRAQLKKGEFKAAQIQAHHDRIMNLPKIVFPQPKPKRRWFWS